MSDHPGISSIAHWRSITTLVVFVLSNLVVLFPFHIPIYIYRPFADAFLRCLVNLRAIPPQPKGSEQECGDKPLKPKPFVRLKVLVDLNTGPLIGVLFLLSTTAIGRREVKEGTLGANNISPMDLVAFALTLGYVSSSIDASGFIKFLTFKVLQVHGRAGHRLFILLYVIFFAMGCFFGNDPVIHMGMLFLIYMNRMSTNLRHPRAWIHTQFAIANIASAIFVSSNTTNVVIAQAFQIGFAEYTANLVVPVMASAVVLAPTLLYIIFSDENLIPLSIKLHELPEASRIKRPVPPNVPFSTLEHMLVEDEEEQQESSTTMILRVEEVMNPFLDKLSAAFGLLIMATTLAVLLSLTAANLNNVPVFWVTLPASFVMLCWDAIFGWFNRHETREIARQGRCEVERIRAERAIRQEAERVTEHDIAESIRMQSSTHSAESYPHSQRRASASSSVDLETGLTISRKEEHDGSESVSSSVNTVPRGEPRDSDDLARTSAEPYPVGQPLAMDVEMSGGFGGEGSVHEIQGTSLVSHGEGSVRGSEEHDGRDKIPVALTGIQTSDTIENNEDETKTIDTLSTIEKGLGRKKAASPEEAIRSSPAEQPQPTIASLVMDLRTWLQETFPNVSAVVALLPFSLVLFAFPTFILVQSLVSSGWVTVFAHGWNHWVEKTGTVGAIAGMGFLSVMLSNFAGTNIGATVLLSRVLQIWADIHVASATPIADRTYWGAVYALAIGVNYGAFSLAFSASMAGLMWRKDLAKKHIRVRRLEFARVNLPLITIAMATSCAVLVGEVYIMRHMTPYAIRS
ncbi:hypothetical protein QQX98_005096 [Neonectria punicea]|uniref:Citrate transporter-like domain-containing protein n=1 Tax=Neonectria punicea TaxID=979145 RepID=A0ABR1H6A1_9HYPO